MDPSKAKVYLDLFTKDNLKAEYIELMKKYHPDRYKGKDAGEICAKINSLYEEAKSHAASDTWGDEANVVFVVTADGHKKRIKYLYQGMNENGCYYVGNTIVVYSFAKKKFFDNYLNAVKRIHYADDALKDYYERFMPNVLDSFESGDGKYYIVLKKSADVYPLTLVKDIFKQKEHAAWLTTRLLNLSAFLCTTGLVHNGFSMDNVFVSLENHGASLLGGWQYAIGEGEKMIGTNKQVFEVMPAKVKSDKMASHDTDTLAINNILCTLLGGRVYRDLEGIVGKPWAEFLLRKEVHPFDAVTKWEEVRDASFKEHKFVHVNIPDNPYETK